MAQAIVQTGIEAVKASVQTMSEAAGPMERNNRMPITKCMSARTGGPTLKQPTFNWKSYDRYNKLLNSEVEIKIYS